MKRFRKFDVDRLDYYFLLYARNGRVILNSEMYTSSGANDIGIRAVAKAAKKESNFSLLIAKDGRHYFNLIAANHEIVGTSQMYTSLGGAKKGIRSVMVNSQLDEG